MDRNIKRFIDRAFQKNMKRIKLFFGIGDRKYSNLLFLMFLPYQRELVIKPAPDYLRFFHLSAHKDGIHFKDEISGERYKINWRSLFPNYPNYKIEEMLNRALKYVDENLSLSPYEVKRFIGIRKDLNFFDFVDVITSRKGKESTERFYLSEDSLRSSYRNLLMNKDIIIGTNRDFNIDLLNEYDIILWTKNRKGIIKRHPIKEKKLVIFPYNFQELFRLMIKFPYFKNLTLAISKFLRKFL